jgi:hypothetical protein
MPEILATQEADRGQEDRSSKPAWANSSWDPILKQPITKQKRAGGVAQGVGPEFKPSTTKKKKRSKSQKTMSYVIPFT